MEHAAAQSLTGNPATDLIDLSRVDGVDGFGDIQIDQTSDFTATVRFINKNCSTVEIDLLSDTAFTVTEESFIL